MSGLQICVMADYLLTCQFHYIMLTFDKFYLISKVPSSNCVIKYWRKTKDFNAISYEHLIIIVV